jgi:nucleotide-binding universal stress UspA family protein
MFRIRRILFPTDFSSYSTQAYFHAVALAETHRAALVILYVYQADRDAVSDRGHWREQLEQIRPANPDIPVDHVLLEGDPSVEIPRFAAEAGVDMVVMGTHGRTGQERLLMGSVAEQTLRTAPCSVLVVKMPRRVADVKPDIELAGVRA